MELTDDKALLRAYCEGDSEQAFAVLISRHVHLVYSVALRQVSDPHHAEEITQAVFIILARKAAQLREGDALASWLFQATCLTAKNFVRSEMRRRRREQEAYMTSGLNESSDDIWQRIAPLLDTAVAGLGEKDQRAIVLRFYEGRSLREVSVALGLTEEAAKKRVSRAVDKLRHFFTRRGVVMSSAILATAISANSVQAAPVAVAKSVAAMAMAKTVASGSTLTLIKGVLKMMAYKKIAIVAAAVTVAVFVGVALSVPEVRTAVKNLPGKVASSLPAEKRKQALVQQMQTMKMAVWPALMKYSSEHQGAFPATMQELRSYLPPGLADVDDDHWRITAASSQAKPNTPELLTFCEQINQPVGEPRIILYADGHVERRR